MDLRIYLWMIKCISFLVDDWDAYRKNILYLKKKIGNSKSFNSHNSPIRRSLLSLAGPVLHIRERRLRKCGISKYLD